MVGVGYILSMDGTARAPKFMETAQVALSEATPEPPQLLAEAIVASRKVLRAAIDKVLAAPDRPAMMAVLEEAHSEVSAAVQILSVVRQMDHAHSGRNRDALVLMKRPAFLRTLAERGIDEVVVERVRLGLRAADDEALLLGGLRGGLHAHETALYEDTKGRFLLMVIAKWVASKSEIPPIFDALTFEFLDTAGRAYGIVASLVHEALEDVA